MPRRFARSKRVVLTVSSGTVEAVIAEGFRLRLLGLIWLRAGELEPLLIPRCRSVHTFGMKAPIDLVWLEADTGRVFGVVEGLEPRRLARAPKVGGSERVSALELPAGSARRLGFRRADYGIEPTSAAQSAQTV